MKHIYHIYKNSTLNRCDKCLLLDPKKFKQNDWYVSNYLKSERFATVLVIVNRLTKKLFPSLDILQVQ